MWEGKLQGGFCISWEDAVTCYSVVFPGQLHPWLWTAPESLMSAMSVSPAWPILCTTLLLKIPLLLSNLFRIVNVKFCLFCKFCYILGRECESERADSLECNEVKFCLCGIPVRSWVTRGHQTALGSPRHAEPVRFTFSTSDSAICFFQDVHSQLQAGATR